MNTRLSLHEIKQASKRAFPSAYEYYASWQNQEVRRRTLAILSSTDTPAHYDAAFDALQKSYVQWWPDYDFDGHSTWARGCERALSLLKLEALRVPKLAVLDAGCGDGVTGHALASYGHEVTLNDTDDWRDPRTHALPFVQGNVCGRLPLAEASFDLLVSYNAFEHIEDPKRGLDELVRLCKVGGHIYIEFNPLYCSPLGLHAFSFMMPYPQFLFSPSFIEANVKELGPNDLNKWRVAQFREVWRSCGCDVVSSSEVVDHRHLGIVSKYPKAFSGSQLTLEDLTVCSMSVLLRKG